MSALKKMKKMCVLFYSLNKLTKNIFDLGVDSAILQVLEARLILSQEMLRFLNISYRASAHFEVILRIKREQENTKVK